MQWLKLCHVRMRYILTITVIAAIYLSINVISNKLEVSSFYWTSELQDLDRKFHILSNQSEASGNTTRSNVIRLFSASAHALNVEVILIEPSILFNLLKNQQQDLLLKRGYKLTDFRYVPGIITFGFLNKYKKYINRPEFVQKMYQNGFNYIDEYDSCNHVSTLEVGSSGHCFFMMHGWIIHMVEFVRKLNYLRHSSLPANNCSSLPNREDLHFVACDGIYENFDGILINKESKIALPHRPLRFLHEMKTSKFLSCRALLQPQKKHPQESKVANIIREMKAVLHPHLYDFWLTSGTLLGWYRECGIIPYTSDVDFGMRASDVESVESILKLFRQSGSLNLVIRYGLAEEALELTLDYKGVRVDIFFFYEERNQSYVACHYESSNSYAKVLYPPFSLCSAVLMGEKVLVPCETETILRTEYGPNWTQPVSKWDWKNSFFNKGQEIYWDDSKKKQVYEYFRYKLVPFRKFELFNNIFFV